MSNKYTQVVDWAIVPLSVARLQRSCQGCAAKNVCQYLPEYKQIHSLSPEQDMFVLMGISQTADIPDVRYRALSAYLAPLCRYWQPLPGGVPADAVPTANGRSCATCTLRAMCSHLVDAKQCRSSNVFWEMGLLVPVNSWANRSKYYKEIYRQVEDSLGRLCPHWMLG